MGLFRQRVAGLIVIVVLAASPVSGAICAAACVPTASGADRATAEPHAAETHCQPAAAGGAALRAVADHGCGGHDGSAPEATAAPAAARADTGMRPVARNIAWPAAPYLSALAGHRVRSGSSPPAATAARARLPRVLRI